MWSPAQRLLVAAARAGALFAPAAGTDALGSAAANKLLLRRLCSSASAPVSTHMYRTAAPMQSLGRTLRQLQNTASVAARQVSWRTRLLSCPMQASTMPAMRASAELHFRRCVTELHGMNQSHMTRL